ncbi:MAG: cytidine deaminase [Acidobacteriota bacterium]
MEKEIKELYDAAKKVKEKAYAPYSNFHVGSALRTESGKIFSGCNVENSSYGVTICAERNAVFKMVSEGEQKISSILVIGDTEKFLPPCGACRQVIAEFSDEHTAVIMCNKDGKSKETTVGEILPFGFSLKEDR